MYLFAENVHEEANLQSALNFIRPMLACCVVALAANQLCAQSVTGLQGRTLKVGHSITLTLQGTDFNDSLRVIASRADVELKIVSVEATQATIQATLPADAKLGFFSLHFAFASGLIHQATVLADDLEPVVDQATNHDQATAQSVPNRCSIEGICDATRSDFYRLSLASATSLAFEVHTQPLRSPMDPVLRLYDANGVAIFEADDGALGPDCAFNYRFDSAGDYFIEVGDSRYAAGGAAYQLRVGDFPVVEQAFPGALAAATATDIAILDAAGLPRVSQTVQSPPGPSRTFSINTRLPEGRSSNWLPLWLSQLPQHIESAALLADPLSLPVGVSGRLEKAGEVDTYRLRATQGQALRIVPHTRGIGSPALLKMQLFSSADALIAETQVSEQDEWALDAVLPEDGEVRLQISDLLQRGGAQFNYALEIFSGGTFAVAFKADPAQGDQFAIELEHGAAAIDLQIQRWGYDGPIVLDWETPAAGLRIVNPVIAAGASVARIYLAADSAWQTGDLARVRLIARRAEEDAAQSPGDLSEAAASMGAGSSLLVGSRELRRLREPFLISPAEFLNGSIVASAIAASAVPFALEPAAPVQLARSATKHKIVLNLRRTQPEFKAAVELLPLGLKAPSAAAEADTRHAGLAGWQFAATFENDVYTLNFLRPSPALTAAGAGAGAGAGVAEIGGEVGGEVEPEPKHISLLSFATFNGRGQLQSHDLPIEWIDPLKVALEFPEPWIQGGALRVRAIVQRQGNDPQPVVLTAAHLPEGLILPAPITLPADQRQVEFELGTSAAATFADGSELILTAASQYAGNEFSVTSSQRLPPAIAGPQTLNVFPPQIQLRSRRAQQQLVITAGKTQTDARDWTRLAKISVENPAVAEIRQGAVHPLATGATELIVQVGAVRQSVPLIVELPTTAERVDFESEVLVALSKQGCNSGACHGSPTGKGGFRLSLRAFDLQLDQLTLIYEEYGRRTNVLAPEQSLMLLKPTMQVPHGGGKQLHVEDTAYKLLRDWVAQGATADPIDTPRIERIEVYPNDRQVLSVADGGQQLAVTAHLADGTQRDVTHIVAYESSDDSVATVTPDGWVQPQGRGEVAVLVRCLEYIETVPLLFIEPQADFEWAAPAEINYVDTLVHKKLQQLQYLPAPAASDAEFLRRVSLDVIGILPSVQETQAFLADASPDKRSRLIDALLERPEYSKFWALKWGDLLKLTSKLVGDAGVHKYYRWLETSLRDNQPYDQFARELLTSSGSTLSNPPANFYRAAANMNESVENISQVFLGARVQCAKCHNHPFERWTQDNYYGLGAFFNRVQRRQTQRLGEQFIYTAASGEVTQPRTGKLVQPWLPQTGSIVIEGDDDRRVVFVDWLVDPANPYFARIEANRLWSHLFARGIVDPIDDFRDSNPPSNAELLDALAEDFIASGYDRKHLLRVILNSQTYQASCQTNRFNQDDRQYFSHQEPRLLGAEQLLDAINRTLAITQPLGNLPAGTLATHVPAPDIAQVAFLKALGQPERSTVCACERSVASDLGMAIELINGPAMHEKLRDPNNRFRQSLAAGASVSDIVFELYMTALCRPASESELAFAIAHCNKHEDPAVGLEDVCWALLNCDEFLFQH